MVKAEIDMLKELVAGLESTIRDFPTSKDPEELYDLTSQASALYGADVPEVQEAFELLTQHSGLVGRQSTVILRLLQRKLVRDENAFLDGIMPLTLERLSVCPAAQEVYRSGIAKYSGKIYERNILDDMRLALELLVKQILANDKSLENQIAPLGTKLGGYHVEFRNLVTKMIDYLCKYQNNYVKHNDAVNPAEIDCIIEQTSAIINFLITVQ